LKELCEKERVGLERGRSVSTLLAMVLIAAVASPAAQALRKDSNTKSSVSASEVQQRVSGKELFHQRCASCHFAETSAQKIGPGLKGLYARLTFSDGKKVTDASLTRWIESGGKNMPGFKESIKPEQIRELISYIKTL
jgi:cytochrome c